MSSLHLRSFVSMLAVTLFLLGAAFPLSAQKQDDVERRILVMFQPNSARLPEGRDRGSIGEAVLPVRVKQLLQEARAEEIAKGIPAFKQADTLRVLNDGRIYKTLDYTNLFVIRLPRGVDRQAVIDSLQGQPAVAIVEKDQRPIFRELVPNDTNFNLQWNLKNTGQFGGAPGADIKATQAWDITTGSSSVKLGFIDTGVQGNHPDFSNRVSGDSQFLTDHGTAVAGVAAATGNNSIGVAGVDWNAAIHAEAIDDFHISNVTAIIAAIDDAVTAGARVLNNSWGIAGFSQLLSDQFLAAYQADVLPITSNPQDGSAGEFPSLFGSWMLNVAATTDGDAQASTPSVATIPMLPHREEMPVRMKSVTFTRPSEPARARTVMLSAPLMPRPMSLAWLGCCFRSIPTCTTMTWSGLSKGQPMIYYLAVQTLVQATAGSMPTRRCGMFRRRTRSPTAMPP